MMRVNRCKDNTTLLSVIMALINAVVPASVAGDAAVVFITSHDDGATCLVRICVYSQARVAKRGRKRLSRLHSQFPNEEFTVAVN